MIDIRPAADVHPGDVIEWPTVRGGHLTFKVSGVMRNMGKVYFRSDDTEQVLEAQDVDHVVVIT